MKSDLLKKRLRSSFFTQMSNLSIDNYIDALTRITKDIHHLIQSKYTSFYERNVWTNEFELITDLYVEKNYRQFKDAIKKTIKSNSNNQSIHRIPHMNYDIYIIPINKQFILNFIISNNNICEQKVAMIKYEVSKFLSAVTTYIQKHRENEKSSFLCYLSLRIFSTSEEDLILGEIISELERFYPSFSYRVLLSQDHKIDPSLPVYLIDYTDDVTKRVSTQAFMTGDIQVEIQSKKKCTYVYVPLKGSQGIYGVLQVIVPSVVHIPSTEIRFFDRFGQISGQAIENSFIYQTTHSLVADLKLINDVAHKLNKNLEKTEIVSVMKEQISNILQPTEIGFAYLENQKLNSLKIYPKSTMFFKTPKAKKLINSLVDQMIDGKDYLFSGDCSKQLPALKYRSLAAIPMRHDSTMIGLVVMLHKKPSAFSFQNFKLVESIIQHSSLAQSNAMLKEQLENAVITDYLTKLYSRNYLDDSINLHMAADELGTLVLFDIDDFKYINDTYGHHVGDRVIVQVANILLENAKDDAIPTRWGGEELALYLPKVSIKQGLKTAENIRKKVEKQTHPQVTLSSGVAMWQKSDKISVDDLFIRADQALYNAKNSGKNKVVIDGLSS